MLTASEIRDACDAIDKGGAEGALAVIVNRKSLVSHLRRLYSADSSSEGIEAALREAGLEETRFGNMGSRWVSRRHHMIVDEFPGQGFRSAHEEHRTIHTVGQFWHLIAAAELAQEGGE